MMENENKLIQMGMEALICIARDLKTSYSVKGSFSHYGIHREKCTVTLTNKSFTAYGPKCLQESIKEAVLYAVNTFSIFEGIKAEINAAAALAKMKEVCATVPFDGNFLRAKDNLSYAGNE